MRTRWFGYTSATLAFVAGLSVTGPAFTQGTAQPELQVETKAALTADQQISQADAIQRRAAALADRLAKMLDEARTDKDIMRANCVNRKLTEVNANARNVEQRSRALKDARNGGDTNRGNHEFTVLSVLSQKLDTLQREAGQCLGQSLFEPGASQVITTIAPNTPVVDPTELTPTPTAPPVFTVPPAAVSPAS
ncbi:MAG: hypothetical protein QM778_08900 [Myxococcales bacterium]